MNYQVSVKGQYGNRVPASVTIRMWISKADSHDDRVINQLADIIMVNGRLNESMRKAVGALVVNQLHIQLRDTPEGGEHNWRVHHCYIHVITEERGQSAEGLAEWREEAKAVDEARTRVRNEQRERRRASE